MKNIILFFLLFLSFFASAQDIKTLVPKGSKVFLQVNNKSTYKKTHDYLVNWGYWQMVDSKKDADFKLKVFILPPTSTATGANTVWADFYSKDNEDIYTTECISLTYNLEAFEAVKKLINKQIKSEVE